MENAEKSSLLEVTNIDHLGVTFEHDFAKGEVKVDVIDCIKSMLEEFPIKFEKKKDNDKTIALSTAEMFSEDLCKKLAESERETFHKLFVAKGLFASKRGRQDVQPVVSVLCTRVKNPG